MAQAAADPFDSLENSPDSLASTDDLLSQMAGKEVDRLLAENEPDSAEAPAPFPDAPPLEQQQSMTAQLDELFTDLQNSPGAPAQQKPPEAKISASTEGEERAALLEAAGFDGPRAAPAELEGDSQDPINEAPKGPERSALLEAAGFEASDSSSPTAAPAAAAITEPAAEDAPANNLLAPLPRYLKPLEWLNAPLDTCPAGVRQLLGKAAILTLINALAVLAYVLVIRKH